MKKDDESEARDKKIIKQTDKIILDMAKQKAVRHVKEENEPMFDILLNDFNEKYAKMVAGKSSIEILKFVKNEL